MALGRGLDALLGDTTLQAQTGGSVNLPISQVEPGLNQPRKHFDEEALADLAESIRQHGMLQPLTVRRLASGYYQIIAGERRWRAARQAGLEEVPAIIIEADDRKVMELGLIENLQREDLNPMEEAAGYRTLIQDYGLTQEEAARRVRKSRPAVANAMPQQSKFTLTLDGRQVQSEGLGVLLVNFSKIQFDIAVTHDNKPRDGEFDVVVLKAKTAFDLIPAAIAGLLDRDGEFPDRTDALEIFRAKEVTIEADPTMEVQYDGEATGLSTPFSARIMPRATRLFISDEGYSQFAR